jgi:hypothetical protein
MILGSFPHDPSSGLAEILFTRMLLAHVLLEFRRDLLSRAIVAIYLKVALLALESQDWRV